MADVKVQAMGFTLEYDHAEKLWSCAEPRAEGLVLVAQALTDTYRYSPADGPPGYRLAEAIAKRLGGTAVLPPVPEAPPDVVY